MTDREQFDALKLKGWKNLTKEERVVYKSLKDVLEPKKPKVLNVAEPITEESLKEPMLTEEPIPSEAMKAPAVEVADAVQLDPIPAQPPLDLQHKLIAIFSEIHDSDDKSKIGALVNSDMNGQTQESLFKLCFNAVQDGGSRAIIRKYLETKSEV